MERKRTGGGRFDPAAPPMYFIASDASYPDAVWPVMENILYAISDRNVARGDLLERAVAHDPPLNLLVDSGVFTLAMDHARAHQTTMYEALRLRPQEIDGFDALWEAYTSVIPAVEDDLWGYIELDQGGRDVKRENRLRCEQLGLRPIPVYHPYLDGWDYLDELCEGYDRVAIGNLAVSPVEERRSLARTIWERQREHPDVWIHLLGVTAGPMVLTYPCHSCDSSIWMIPMQYGKPQSYAHTAHYPPRKLNAEWAYDREQDANTEAGAERAAAHAALEIASLQRMWRHHVADSLANRFEVA